MQFRETDFGFLVVLEPGDPLVQSLTDHAAREGVGAATLTGLGAVRRVELGYYRLDSQDYIRRRFDEELEICALAGTIALADGAPFPHVHGLFSRPDFSVVGGHVFEAVCSVTVELAIHTTPEPAHRRAVDFCNLKLIRMEANP